MSEGDAWWERNKNKLPKPEDDPVLELIRINDVTPTGVLEIGCGNGWRLSEIRKRYGCPVVGIDLSQSALNDGRKRYPSVNFAYGSASHLGYFGKDQFNLVIFGFCLYLVDREDLFKVVTESDRVLADGGYLIIQDFPARIPTTVPYKHDGRLRTYKMYYPDLWLSNPSYQMLGACELLDIETGTYLMVKDNSIWQD